MKNHFQKFTVFALCLALGVCVIVSIYSARGNREDEAFRNKVDQKLMVAQQRATQLAIPQYPPTPSSIAPSVYPKHIKHGLYEATLTFANRGESGSYYVEKTDFIWVRLYKNGTYRTSQSAKGKIEGRYFYDPKSGTITWKNPFKEEDSMTGGHVIWNGLQSYYEDGKDFGYRLHWHITGVSYSSGEVDCRWKRP